MSHRTEARLDGRGVRGVQRDNAAPNQRIQRRWLLISPHYRCPALLLPPRLCLPSTSRVLLSTNGLVTGRSIQALCLRTYGPPSPSRIVASSSEINLKGLHGVGKKRG